MSTTRDRRTNVVARRALRLRTTERGRFLERACRGDAALRGDVDDLMRAHGEMGGFLGDSASARLTEQTLEPGTRIDAYEIIRVLGRGGGGTVYEARQDQPDRSVALKVARVGFGSTGAQRRFRQEAEILARLDHPDIAHVYDAGVHEGVPYFAMELVRGARPVTGFEGDRLALFARICDAVQHGHQKGIIHRDLKPSNVLVKPDGGLKVIDFGIARMGEIGGAEIAGTLPYMSPEQRAGDHLDVRSDVYALGVMLHEMSTGRLPGATLPGPPEFAAILARALHDDREARYPSAAALAEDVRRIRAHEPVGAYAGGLLYQARKFARRHRAASLLAVAIVLLSIASALVSGRLAAEREEQRLAAEFQSYVANMAAAYAALRASDVGEARDRLDRAPAAHWNWEWRHLHGRLDTSARTLVRDQGKLGAGAVSPDGGILVVPADPMWAMDTTDRRELWRSRTAVHGAEFDASGTWIVERDSRTFRVRDARTGAVLVEKWGHDDQVRSARFDPAAARIATASYDGTVKIWSSRDARLLRTLRGKGHMHVAAFTPDGTSVMAGGVEKAIRCWDAATGELRFTLQGHHGFVEDLDFNADGSLLVSGDMDGRVIVWDLRARTVRARCAGHTQFVKQVVFARDGRTFASAGADRTVRVWSVEDGRELARHVGHTAEIYGLAPYREGIVSFSYDGTVRSWSTLEESPVRTVWTGVPYLSRIRFSPGGDRLLLSGESDVLQARDSSTLQLVATCRTGGRVSELSFDEGRPAVVTGFAGGHAFEWTPGGALHRGEPRAAPRSRGARRTAVARADARRTAEGFEDGRLVVREGSRVRQARPFASAIRRIALGGGRVAAIAERPLLLDARTLEVVRELRDGSRAVAFSPDGSRLATGGNDGAVRIWDAASGEQVAVLHGHTDRVLGVGWSPDGNVLVSGTQQGELKRWDTEPSSAPFR